MIVLTGVKEDLMGGEMGKVAILNLEKINSAFYCKVR